MTEHHGLVVEDVPRPAPRTPPPARQPHYRRTRVSVESRVDVTVDLLALARQHPDQLREIARRIARQDDHRYRGYQPWEAPSVWLHEFVDDATDALHCDLGPASSGPWFRDQVEVDFHWREEDTRALYAALGWEATDDGELVVTDPPVYERVSGQLDLPLSHAP